MEDILREYNKFALGHILLKMHMKYESHFSWKVVRQWVLEYKRGSNWSLIDVSSKVNSKETKNLFVLQTIKLQNVTNSLAEILCMINCIFFKNWIP